MGYTKKTFEEAVKEFGEVYFVLDSDREYIIHGTNGYEFVERDAGTFVKADGLHGDEYLSVEFPLDSIEHHYAHLEV